MCLVVCSVVELRLLLQVSMMEGVLLFYRVSVCLLMVLYSSEFQLFPVSRTSVLIEVLIPQV